MDDAATLEGRTDTLVVTHDTMVEGIHFATDADPADVAWKLVAVNLSDLAAKGARLEGVMLSYALGGGEERFLEGLGNVLRALNIGLLGGDTTASRGPRSFGLTAIGRAVCVPVPSRSHAKPGDALWLCGRLGWAMLGYEGAGGEFAQALHRPVPLIEEGLTLAPVVNAMMDVSDGLLLDATRMAQASGVTIDIATAHLPVADRSRLIDCLTWGDDYALLFTCEAGRAPPVDAVSIGSVGPAGAHPLLIDGTPPAGDLALGYQHG